MSDNFVAIIGTTTRDIELRYTSSGTTVGDVGIAFNERVKGPDGQWEDGDPSFFDVTIWGSLAENAADSISKGTRVSVTGRLKMDSWENDQGEKRTKVKIVADSISPDLRWASASVEKNSKGSGSKRAAASSAVPDDDEAPF